MLNDQLQIKIRKRKGIWKVILICKHFSFTNTYEHTIIVGDYGSFETALKGGWIALKFAATKLTYGDS